MKPFRCMLFLLLALLVMVPAAPAENPEVSPMAAYLAKEDDSYTWKTWTTMEEQGTVLTEIRMTSQTWKGVEWKHMLYVAQPEETIDNDHAVVFISGGSWRDRYDKEEPGKTSVAREMLIAGMIARAVKLPVMFVKHIPFQPMFEGRKEDAAIAYTFDQYLKTGDKEWPLLLPMVKASQRALDTFTEFSKDAGWDHPVSKFVVTGASKRGWTTWLMGAVDDRVAAILPMVFDTLDLAPQMKHQVAAWGKFSDMIRDYTEYGLQEKLVSDEGKELVSIVDPWFYRDQFADIPKYILLGTNDPYWPVDALNLYWDGLKGEKYIMYAPNKGHDLGGDIFRAVNCLAAMSKRAVGKLTFPELGWSFEEGDDKLTITVTSDVKPESPRAWIASAKTRDFRPAKWKQKKMDEVSGEDGTWQYTIDRPANGWSGLFCEMIYEVDGQKFPLCTAINLIEAKKEEKTGARDY